MDYKLDIYPNEDYELIENEEEREEAEERFFNDIEAVYQYLKCRAELDQISFEQITDTTFNVTIKNFTSKKYHEKLIQEIAEHIKTILELKDIASLTYESYEEA